MRCSIRSSAGDHRHAGFGQVAAQPASPPVLGVGTPNPGRTEDADRRTDVGERVEALDELAEDAQRAPWIGVLEIEFRADLEELLILGRAFGLTTHDQGASPP